MAIAATGTAAAQTPGEATFDRICRTGVLRIAALPGEMPFFERPHLRRVVGRRNVSTTLIQPGSEFRLDFVPAATDR